MPKSYFIVFYQLYDMCAALLVLSTLERMLYCISETGESLLFHGHLRDR